MSYRIAISTDRSMLPQPARWNAAIAEKGFELRLDPFDWNTHSGHLPVVFIGIASGFELSAEPASDGRSVEVAVDLGGSQFELAAASVALSVLQGLTGGGYGDDDGQALEPAEFDRQARDLYARCRILKARLDAPQEAAWDQPALMAGESRDDRVASLAGLVQGRILVKDEGGAGATYRLHKLRAEELRRELAGPQDA